MDAALSGNSGRSNTQLTRSLERILEEAQLTGELHLSGRKFKEFPKVASKYDLEDTVAADLSKNRLTELPHEVCEYISIEKLNCYHNVIRIVPDNIIQLQSLTHLNLSRNQLSTIPPSLCQLHMLHVLLICHNKLVSLPEEICKLHKLVDLDVSCNEISHLPRQIGYLKSLRSLNLRRNLLVELPVEITALRLVFLDVSENQIVHLPTRLRIMETLEDLLLVNNPLSCPPAYLCTRGKVHIFKFLDSQAQKDERRKGTLAFESELRELQRGQNISIDTKINGLTIDSRQRRPPIDSGYCTSEGDKRWSQDSQDNFNPYDDSRRLALRAAELTKEKRQGREKEYNNAMSLNTSISIQAPSTTHPPMPSYVPNEVLTNGNLTSRMLSPNSDVSFENEINKLEPTRQKMLIRPDQKLMEGESPDETFPVFERHLTSSKLLEQQLDEARRNSSQHNSNSTSPTTHCNTLNPRKNYVNYNDCAEGTASDSTQATVERNSKPQAFTQTYREYKEALKLQRSFDTNNVYRRVQSDTGFGISAPTVVNSVDSTFNYTPQPQAGIPVVNHISCVEDYSSRLPDGYNDHRCDVNLTQLRQDDEKRKQKFLQKEAVRSYVKSRTSPLRSSTDSDHHSSEDYGSKSSSPSMSPCPPVSSSVPVPQFYANTWENSPQNPQPVNGNIHHYSAIPRYSIKSNQPITTNYTMRRESERAREEKEQIELLRQAIETRLKVSLPDDIASALVDGVVLCHLANHVRPRSVASIHVPSPSVPKLTVAKCRRNIENFLEACRRIGVAEEHLCTCDDILHGLPVPRNVLECIDHLVKGSSKSAIGKKPSVAMPSGPCLHQKQDDALISCLCIVIFFGSVLLLYFLPEY